MKFVKKIYAIFCIVCIVSSQNVSAATYDTTLTVDSNIQHGTITLSASQGNVGDTITVTPKPSTGY